MTFDEWGQSVPHEVRADCVWKIEAYRSALFLADIGWRDVTKLSEDRRTRSLSDQLYRALCSISANLEEGYSRGSGKDRARFYEYSLGSVRESRGWYYKGRHILGQPVVTHRIALLTQVIRLLLTMVSDQRGVTFNEEPDKYHVVPVDDIPVESLLTQAPYP